MITIKENVKSVEDFNKIFDKVGWGAHEDEVSKKALENTYYSVSIYDDGEIIGFGRLIGDTICYMYIHDVVVAPEYQGKKIGTMIMNKLLEKVEELRKENPYIRVYLGAAKGKEGFYKHFNFIEREEANLGPGMIYNKIEED